MKLDHPGVGLPGGDYPRDGAVVERRLEAEPAREVLPPTANYRSNLVRFGWPEKELEPPGSDRLFDAVVAWGRIGRLRERVELLFSAGEDQVVLNLVTADPAIPYVDELEQLSVLARWYTALRKLSVQPLAQE